MSFFWRNLFLLFCFAMLGCQKRLPLLEIQDQQGVSTNESNYLNQFFYTSNATDKDFVANKESPRVYAVAPHNRVNAFPDLHYENEFLYVVYRSSTEHVYGTDGVILYEIYDTSFNFLQKVQIFSELGFDCRDPKILRLSGDTIMIHFHAYIRNSSDGIIRKRRNVLKYLDIKTGMLLKEFKYEGDFDEIPWHWHLARDPNIEGVFHAWGNNSINFSRDIIIPQDSLIIKGTNFIDIGANPGEGRLRFNHQNIPVTLVRRRSDSMFLLTEGNKLHPIGLNLGEIGGPNFLYLNNRIIFFTGRILGNARIYKFDLLKKKIYHVLDLPSKGDLGYFGMSFSKNTLFLVYYSTHESRIITKVYLTKIHLTEI